MNFYAKADISTKLVSYLSEFILRLIFCLGPLVYIASASLSSLHRSVPECRTRTVRGLSA